MLTYSVLGLVRMVSMPLVTFLRGLATVVMSSLVMSSIRLFRTLMIRLLLVAVVSVSTLPLLTSGSSLWLRMWNLKLLKCVSLF